MYHVISDGLLNPRNLLRYRNKSGWFVLAFFAVLAFFCTIGAALFYVNYARDAGFTAARAACAYEAGTLVCDEAGHDYSVPLDFFGGEAYFLPTAADVPESTDDLTLVFQDEYLAVFSGGTRVTVIDLTPQLAAGMDLDAIMASLETGFIVVAVLMNFLGNILLLAVFTLMSTVSLFRLRNYIRFGKAYTVLAFASVPFALVLTFHNILQLPEWALMILLFVSFRSSFLVIRELYSQAYEYLNHQDPSAGSDDEGDDGSPPEE